MNIADRISRAWGALRGREKAGPPTGGLGASYGYGPTFSDAFRLRRAPSPAELVESYKALIYACVNLNANAVARGTLRLYAVTRGGQGRPRCAVKAVGRRTRDRLVRLGYLAKTLAGAQEIDEVTEHPLLSALRSGNDELDEAQLLQFTSMSLDVVGSAYWWPDAASRSIPVAFWALPPHLVGPVFESGALVPDRYRFGGTSFGRRELIRFRRLSMKNPYGHGYAPAQAAIEYARLEDSYVSLQDELLSNGPRPAVVVSHRDPKGTFGAAERKRLEDDLNRRGRGGRAGVAFVVDGAASIEPMSYSPTDLAGLELSRYDMERCANAFDVPVSMLTNESSNRAVAEAGLEQHARNAVEPRHRIIAGGLTRWTHALGRRLADESGRDPGYDRLAWAFDPAVPEEARAEAELHRLYVDMGALTRNEVRLEIGYAPDPDGDVLLVPDGLAPLGSLLES